MSETDNPFAVGRYWKSRDASGVYKILLNMADHYEDIEGVPQFVLGNSSGGFHNVGCVGQLEAYYYPLPRDCTGFDWQPETFTPVQVPKQNVWSVDSLSQQLAEAKAVKEQFYQQSEVAVLAMNRMIGELSEARVEVSRLQSALADSDGSARVYESEVRRLTAELAAMKDAPQVGDMCMFKMSDDDDWDWDWEGPFPLESVQNSKNGKRFFYRECKSVLCGPYYACRLATPAELAAAGIQQEQPT